MATSPWLLAFTDLETTGHDPLRKLEYMGADFLIPWHEIIEIGCVVADADTLAVIGSFERKVMPTHPERCIPNIINHFPERLARGEWVDAFSLKEAMAAFLERLKLLTRLSGKTSVTLIGQNFTFDWAFLSVALAKCGIDESEWSKAFHYSRKDTSSMALQEVLRGEMPYDPKEYSLRGGILQKKLGILPEPEPHTALAGAHLAHHTYLRLRELRNSR